MPVSPLPDRERRHLLQFHVLPSMAYGRRIAIALPAIFFALLIQALAPPGAEWLLVAPSFVLLAGGNALLLLKGYDARPSADVRKKDGATRGENWEKTTRDRLHGVRRLEREATKWDNTMTDITCVPGCATMVALLMASVVVFIVLAESGMRTQAILFGWDAGILLLPHWVTGVRRVWRPLALSQQVRALEVALAEIDSYDEPPCQVQPMFLTSGKEGDRVPLAARVFVRLPDARKDFLGVQFQVALNDVQGTKFPYLYAVIIARHSFGLDSKKVRLNKERGRTKLTVERNRESDVDVIVIRQHTTKKSGYHTKDAAIRDIVRTAWHAVSDMVG